MHTFFFRSQPALILCLFALALGGCSSDPVYRTQYDLIQPTSNSGKQCVVGCETNRLLCEQRNDDRITRCEEQADRKFNNCEADAKVRLDSCNADLKRRYGSAWTKYATNCSAYGSGCYRDVCSTRSSCDTGHRACFGNCGGEVKSRSVCVRNCN